MFLLRCMNVFSCNFMVELDKLLIPFKFLYLTHILFSVSRNLFLTCSVLQNSLPRTL